MPHDPSAALRRVLVVNPNSDPGTTAMMRDLAAAEVVEPVPAACALVRSLLAEQDPGP